MPSYMVNSQKLYICTNLQDLWTSSIHIGKSLYGLKQAPRAWNARLSQYLAMLGFSATKSDSSLFVYKKGPQIAYLLLYVDDIVLTGSSPAPINSIITSLKNEFSITDMGRLSHFLGLKVEYNSASILLSQQQYASEIIKRAGMVNCKPLKTPSDVNSKLSANEGKTIDDLKLYRS